METSPYAFEMSVFHAADMLLGDVIVCNTNMNKQTSLASDKLKSLVWSHKPQFYANSFIPITLIRRFEASFWNELFYSSSHSYSPSTYSLCRWFLKKTTPSSDIYSIWRVIVSSRLDWWGMKPFKKSHKHADKIRTICCCWLSSRTRATYITARLQPPPSFSSTLSRQQR